jgi:Domain of unknown function (DUF4091)
MPPTLRARSLLVALTTLCASVPLAATAASCGGGGGSSTGAQASDGGSRDRGPGDDGGVAGDDATHDGTSALADAPTGDAGDPCAADTGGTSGTTAITAVWANEGGDKVTQDELRATGHATVVLNSVWDGLCIRTFGAKNEVVSFNVVLEAATSKATKISVSLGDLTGPGGTVIRSAPRTTDKLFDWTTTEAELFYVRYLQIKGLSQQAYGTLASWQEATFPKRAQCPGMTQATPDSKPAGSGCPWTQRPVANKFYPDIAVPLELVPTFDIAASSNQSIWADVSIPGTAPPGIYGAMLTIREDGAVTHKIPVSLRVRNFALPDAPSARTMLFTSYGDIAPRYAGMAHPDPSTPQGMRVQTALRNERLMAHRHRISLIGDDANQTGTQPGSDYLSVLDGSFFSAANGYAGPGAGTGQDVYSIGTYGGLTEGSTQSQFTGVFNGWETWFEAHAPATERFVYLCDEIDCTKSTPTLATQLQWWAAIGGVGSKLHTMATQPLLDAPMALSDPTSSWPFSDGVSGGGSSMGGTTAADQAAADAVVAADPTRRLFSYNGQRPGSGSSATEDDGVALREQPWGQYKKKIDRWFWWEATYYDDNQQGLGTVDLYSSADTFGVATSDPTYGASGGANGNGVFMYPGTDTVFPSSSYGIAGPIASLRLKHWRRGLEDVDYLTLAAAIDASAVSALVAKMVPSVLWEQQCHDPANDCSYTYAPPSWSDKPDDWEAARAALAHIIDGL